MNRVFSNLDVKSSMDYPLVYYISISAKIMSMKLKIMDCAGKK